MYVTTALLISFSVKNLFKSVKNALVTEKAFSIVGHQSSPNKAFAILPDDSAPYNSHHASSMVAELLSLTAAGS